MKWRIVPTLDLDRIKSTRCLLLGSGTLGSYIGRALLAWGVRKITFVDNGKVSFSNPVRQPLFEFIDCIDGGKPKAETAAENMKRIFPLVDAQGFTLEVPMAGHPITDETKQKQDFDKLEELVQTHDVIFLLMDSRETRWLPTVMGNVYSKLVINAALGFESYLVMRHGCINSSISPEQQQESRLGCYFCNDVRPDGCIIGCGADGFCLAASGQTVCTPFGPGLVHRSGIAPAPVARIFAQFRDAQAKCQKFQILLGVLRVCGARVQITWLGVCATGTGKSEIPGAAYRAHKRAPTG
ncbi:hypothetical protein KL942_004258 [Ogataea angusta]|uniref:THIF-type NAD/FAD binding fold domain-containing protein n=1 Tax=Pichia angusta TaxID=870730 RepID=A0ABQ7RTE8_PICAN|nr:hypothetical protein KL942_004258 [Ogataea angusta]KAG7847295.1 hypothetical protein KL940_004041 [Ogataea angusta]KAG7856941.1 hypothetical protein KL939_003726 [Ogataea angusta]